MDNVVRPNLLGGGVTIYRDFLATDHISIEIAIPIFFDNRCLKFGFFLHNEPTRLFRDFHWFFLGKTPPWISLMTGLRCR